MIYLPNTPATGGAMLAAYIRKHPDRRAIFDCLQSRLGPAGRVGLHARYYIVRRPERRAVFRGILICLNYRLPRWAKDNPEAAERNRAFCEAHREAYEAFRLELHNAA